MNNKLSKILISIGVAVAALSIFLLFAPAYGFKDMPSGQEAKFPSMFNLMFGTGNDKIKVGGLTAVFVLQIIVIVLAIVIIVGMLTKKIPTKGLVAIVIIDCALILTCAILSFCTKSLYTSAYLKEVPELARESVKKAIDEQFKLGTGAILYSVFGLVGLVATVSGLVARKLGK